MKYLLHKVALWDIIHTQVEALGFSVIGRVKWERELRCGVKWEGVLHRRIGLSIKPLPALNSAASFGSSEK